MSRFARFFATCLLLVSLSAVAMADGGQTQGTGFTSSEPPTDCTQGCVDTSTRVSEPDPWADFETVVTMSITLLSDILF